MCRRVDESREMGSFIALRCFSYQIDCRDDFHKPWTCCVSFADRKGVSSYEKIRLHKPRQCFASCRWLCSVIHPQGYVCYERTVLNESDDSGSFCGEKKCTVIDWLIPFWLGSSTKETKYQTTFIELFRWTDFRLIFPSISPQILLKSGYIFRVLDDDSLQTSMSYS